MESQASEKVNGIVVEVEQLVKCTESISPGLAQRIREADVDHDGSLSMTELVEVMRSEQKAVADRKLFRNFLIVLLIAMLVLITTLCGTVYAIVKLTQEVHDDNGVLVSSSTGDVMSTGLIQEAVNISQIFRFENPEVLRSIESLILPSAEGVTMYRIAKISVVPNNHATVYTDDGTVLEVDDSGIYAVETDKPAGSGRRLLTIEDGPYPILPTFLSTSFASSTVGSAPARFITQCINCGVECSECMIHCIELRKMEDMFGYGRCANSCRQKLTCPW